MRQWIASIALLVAPAALAQSHAVPSLAPTIETVVTEGYWTAPDNVEGQFRVVIATGGFEHLISNIWVQWIASPQHSNDSARILKSTHLDEVSANYVRLSDPTLALEDGSWILTVMATQTHCDPMEVKRWRIVLGPPGQFTVVGSDVVERGCE